MLTARQQSILAAVVQEYIASATPVSSQKLSSSHGFQVSSATMRNEMAALEKEGYLTRPHTSAGCTPTDKGYRHYVNSLPWGKGLSPDEERLILHLFHQVEKRLDERARLASAILASQLHTAALTTPPKAAEAHLKHLQLVAVQDFLALLILVLQETSLKSQLISFQQPVTQEGLNSLSQKLNAALANLGRFQIEAKLPQLLPTERQVAETTMDIMKGEDIQEYDELYLEGLRLMLNQPEFAFGGHRADVLGFIEERTALRAMLPRWLTEPGVRVIIGEENEERDMKYCSVVIARYGIPGKMSGAIGIVGPTRIAYGRAIPMVGYLASIMSGLTRELESP